MYGYTFEMLAQLKQFNLAILWYKVQIFLMTILNMIINITYINKLFSFLNFFLWMTN